MRLPFNMSTLSVSMTRVLILRNIHGTHSMSVADVRVVPAHVARTEEDVGGEILTVERERARPIVTDSAIGGEPLVPVMSLNGDDSLSLIA
jgi:hypothetical protein